MTINSPLFSVLIAQYNNGRYLQEAIDSIKVQTYTNWEIILVDDASTDNSKELYKLYENDDRIKIFYNEENKGCGYTKRHCIELANGEICGFLDPDDALLPDAILLMVNRHVLEDKVSLVHSNYIYCDQYLNVLAIHPNAKKVPQHTDYLHFNRGAITHFASFKKLLYDKTIGIDINFKRAVDQDLYYKLEEVGQLFFIDKPLYLYRVHENGISTNDNAPNALYWHIRAIQSACERRNIITEAENIFADLITTYFIQPFQERIDDTKNKILKKPSLQIIIRLMITYFINLMKRIKRKFKRLLLPIFFYLKSHLTSLDYKKIPIIIINFNQLFYFKQMIDFLLKRGFKNIVIIDNNSSYPPLLKYYDEIQSKVTIHRLDTNEGHMVFWKRQDLFEKYAEDYFVITDPDIILNKDLPQNFLKYFKAILDHYISTVKVGTALRIDDIPETFNPKLKVLKWEQQFWENRIAKNIYNAKIDTTFALYRPGYKDAANFFTAIRVAGKYTAGHGGWYVDSENLTEEQKYYANIPNVSSTWKVENDGTLPNYDWL